MQVTAERYILQLLVESLMVYLLSLISTILNKSRRFPWKSDLADQIAW